MKNIDDHSRAVRIGLFSGKGGFRAGIRDLKSREKDKKECEKTLCEDRTACDERLPFTRFVRPYQRVEGKEAGRVDCYGFTESMFCLRGNIDRYFPTEGPAYSVSITGRGTAVQS